jgi:hypothetical protein
VTPHLRQLLDRLSEQERETRDTVRVLRQSLDDLGASLEASRHLLAELLAVLTAPTPTA